MIFTITYYKIYNSKLLVIVEIFKIWQHYFEDYKYKFFILINYNNLRHFIDLKTQASNMFVKLKSCLDIISKSIIIRVRKIKLLMVNYNTLRKVFIIKPLFKLKTTRFYIHCNSFHIKFLAFQQTISSSSTRSSLMGSQSYLRYVDFGTLSEVR